MRRKNFIMYELILFEIKINSKITEKEIAEKYNYTERTIRRYIKELKVKKKIELVKIGKLRYWKLL